MLLTFEVFGDTQMNRELVRFGARAVEAQPAFALIVDDIKEQISQQFDTAGSRSGKPWAPLSPERVAQKAAEGLDPRILHATNRLRQSLTDESGSDQILDVTPQGFTFGSEVEYGAFHQHGTKKMPMRKPVDLTELDRREHVLTLQRYIVSGELVRGGVV